MGVSRWTRGSVCFSSQIGKIIFQFNVSGQEQAVIGQVYVSLNKLLVLYAIVKSSGSGFCGYVYKMLKFVISGQLNLSLKPSFKLILKPNKEI